MNLPKNKKGKYYLVDEKGNEVEFNHAIDATEALFGVFGVDDKNPDFKQRYFLPKDFDVNIKPKRNAGHSKEEKMEQQIRRGRPPKEEKDPPVTDSGDEGTDKK